MKLVKVLKHIAITTKCRIFINEETEPFFEGDVFDVPWPAAILKLNSDINGEAISWNKKLECLDIYVLDRY